MCSSTVKLTQKKSVDGALVARLREIYQWPLDAGSILSACALI
jgi:hypothetical protein